MKPTVRMTTVSAMMLGLSLTSNALADTNGPDEVILRFAVLGDAEPKPEPQFPGLAAAVNDVNRLAQKQDLDFVVGVGDIAHKGTLVQYENATEVLSELDLPFYPIMGNEEHGSSVGRYLEFASRWGQDKAEMKEPSYVMETDPVALVFASPDFGRDFEDEGVEWMLSQMQDLKAKPVLLIAHAAQAGAYPENAGKGVKHEGFSEVIEQPNLAAVISGDLHMDMERVDHSKQIGAVHYLHIPALERTKIPDESRHTPMFRVFSLQADGTMKVETYQVDVPQPLARHDYEFNIQLD